MIDPDGMWQQDADGNLVAEKNDNAQTLAEFLNTSPEIATQMLKQQGFSENNNGSIDLKTSDVFKVESTSIEPESREDFGYIGNGMRNRAHSEYSKNLFENYWKGKGDVEMSSERFAGLLLYIKNHNPSMGKRSNCVLVGSKPTDKGFKCSVNFYGSYEYDYAFGTGTIYMNSEGNIVGFYDFYDFDAKPFGQRTLKAELATRAVSNLSPDTAKPFAIRYGYSKRK